VPVCKDLIKNFFAKGYRQESLKNKKFLQQLLWGKDTIGVGGRREIFAFLCLSILFDFFPYMCIFF
jgi:hypothetical protein